MNRYTRAFKRLKEEIGRISEVEGVAKLCLYMDAAWCFLRYGITPNEYLGWNCWRYSNITLNTFYTARTSAKCELRFNSPQIAHYFDNKVDFNRKFSEFVKREWLYTQEHTKEEIQLFISKHDKMVVKPIGLSSGKGIYCIDSKSIWGGRNLLA